MKIKYNDLLPPLTTQEKESLRADIKKRGVLQPIIVDEDGVILDGHHRFEIDKKAPVIMVKGLTAAEKEAYVYRSNHMRRNLSPDQKKELRAKMKAVAEKLKKENKKWTQAKIATELGVARETVRDWLDVNNGESAKSHTPDSRVKVNPEHKPLIYQRVTKGETQKQVAADYGVDRSLISKIVKKVADKEQKKLEFEEKIKGYQDDKDIKILDKKGGDIFDEATNIPDKSVDLLLTDPPYFMEKADWDEFENVEEFIGFTALWLEVLLPKLKDEYNAFISFNPEYFADLEMLCRELDLPIQSRLIWHYRNAGGKSSGKQKFSKTYEPILHIGNKELNFPDEWNDLRFDVWTIAVPQENFDEGKFHPTQKPTELFRRLVELGSMPGDMVLDPFAGSGTTGVVCKQLKRRCVLVEKSDKYRKIIRGRLASVEDLACLTT